MKEYNFPKLEKKLKKYMDEERFIHTQGVMYTACALAMCHNADMNQARLAGLLHDCAKCIPNSKKLKICQRKHSGICRRRGQPGSASRQAWRLYFQRKIRCHRPGSPAGGPLPYHWTSRNDTS